MVAGSRKSKSSITNIGLTMHLPRTLSNALCLCTVSCGLAAAAATAHRGPEGRTTDMKAHGES